MNIINSIFGKKDKKSTGDAVHSSPATKPGWTGKRQIAVACKSAPFQKSMDVSPDGGLIGYFTPENTIALYETGSDQPKWKMKVLSSWNSSCHFVGQERMLVVSPENIDKPTTCLIQLINTENGSVIAEVLKADIYRA